MNKKYLAIVFAFSLFLSGCGFLNIESIPSHNSFSFAIPPSQNESEYWMYTEKLIQDVKKKYDLMSEKSVEVKSFESAVKSWDLTNEEVKRNVVTKYIIGNETYELVGVKFANPTDNIPEEFAVQLNGKVLFQKPMCFGAEGPIQDVRKINGKLAISYVEGTCKYNGEKEINSRMNIFYDGKTLNEEYTVEGSQYLFSYKDTIGFVVTEGDKHYIFFNGQKISEAFDSIPTTQCCASISPLLNVYENGAFLFRGSKENIYYLTEIDLNKYLELKDL